VDSHTKKTLPIQKPHGLSKVLFLGRHTVRPRAGWQRGRNTSTEAGRAPRMLSSEVTVTRNKASECFPWFPPLGPPVGSALPSPGSSEASSPASTVLWPCATPGAPLAALRCRRLAIPCAVPVVCSRRSRTPNRGPGVRGPVPNAGIMRRETSRASQVPGQPAVPLPCSSTPAGPNPPGHCRGSAWPPLGPQRRLPRLNPAFEAQWHGFRTCCLRFVRRVATQDAKLASGRWPSVTGRDWLPAGLLRKVSDAGHPPFPSLPGARTFRKCNASMLNCYLAVKVSARAVMAQTLAAIEMN